MYGFQGRLISAIAAVAGVLAAIVSSGQEGGLFAVIPEKYKWIVTLLPIVSLSITLFSERLQGGASSPDVREAAAKSDVKKASRRRGGTVLVLLLATSIGFSACGGSDLIRSFRLALAASGPLITSLVQSGAIKENQATLITRDFGDSLSCADTLQADFKGIPKDDPTAKAKKLEASVRGYRCFKVIIDRHNFAANPRVQNVANIAEGILATLVVFYSESGPMVADARRSMRVQTPKDEKDLENNLKKQIDELEKAMKP